jgi:type 1 glutamine amidotransferase
MIKRTSLPYVLIFLSFLCFGQKQIKVLIISGQNNHHWQTSAPIIKEIYNKNKLFSPTLLLTPPSGEDMSKFSPNFKDFDVVCLDYNGDSWPKKTKKNFEKFIKKGGGLIVIHASNNTFPNWPEFNKMIGLGGWGGRNEKDGPYIYIEDGKVIRDYSSGRGGAHGKGEAYQVKTFNKEHAIMKGLPEVWMHSKDELYHSLRGPAENLDVLATATQSVKNGGMGREEPVLFTVSYGKGRIFHTVMGDVWKTSYKTIQCGGFITTLLRGTEWAATGQVTQEVPKGFPGANSPSIWESLSPLNTEEDHKGSEKLKNSFIYKNLKFKGIAVEDKDYTLWGAAPIMGDDGKIHLYIARWPEKNVDPAWRKSSEIAHYISESPEGPFIFSDIAVSNRGIEGWNKYSASNPEIKKVGNQYVLTYISNYDYHQPPHSASQSIGMVISSSPYGPWEMAGKNGQILNADNPNDWNYKSTMGVANPAFLEHKGKFYLYFKTKEQTDSGEKLRYGLAIADNLEGPYTITDKPVTSNKGTLEDGTVFKYNDYIYLLTTDNHGENTGIKGGGTLWKSKDGIQFKYEDASIAYDLLSTYITDYDAEKVTKIYGGDPKMERPKILSIDGKPAYLYGPGGWNLFGGERTVVHAFKINLD